MKNFLSLMLILCFSVLTFSNVNASTFPETSEEKSNSVCEEDNFMLCLFYAYGVGIICADVSWPFATDESELVITTWEMNDDSHLSVKLEKQINGTILINRETKASYKDEKISLKHGEYEIKRGVIIIPIEKKRKEKKR